MYISLKMIVKVLSAELLSGDGTLGNSEIASIAEAVYDELKNIENTRRAITHCRQKEQEAKQVYEATMASIAKDIACVQETCKHWDKNYYADPAGGSSNEVDCDICGKNFR